MVRFDYKKEMGEIDPIIGRNLQRVSKELGENLTVDELQVNLYVGLNLLLL